MMDLPLFAQSPERDAVMTALDRAFDAIPMGSCVTAESLRDRLSFSVREQLQIPTRKNVLGAYFRALAKRKRVAHDGWQEAQRDTARHRALRRWRKIAA
jgi:hypothetical protein